MNQRKDCCEKHIEICNSKKQKGYLMLTYEHLCLSDKLISQRI